MNKFFIAVLAAIPFFIFSCSKDDNSVKVPDAPEVPETIFPYVDTIRAITFNVAGLPQGLSKGDPLHNTSEIGRRLNNYDLVNVQEDFNYNHLLYGTANFKYKTQWSGPVPFGDGLNSMSDHKISDLDRNKWHKCTGADCLTPKGFSYSQLEIVDGITIDLYNIHANAGSETDAIFAARRDNLVQIFDYIQEKSAGRPVILMGDFNSRYTREKDTLDIFQNLNLIDTWVEFARNGVYPLAGDDDLRDCDGHTASAGCETVDRIFYRSNDQIQFEILGYDKPQEEFQRDGKDLSDHIPVSTVFKITVLHK